MDNTEERFVILYHNKHSLRSNTNVIVAKLTGITHKIAIQLHLVAESCIIYSPCSRKPVRKLLYTPSYILVRVSQYWKGHTTVTCWQCKGVSVTKHGFCKAQNRAFSLLTNSLNGPRFVGIFGLDIWNETVHKQVPWCSWWVCCLASFVT
jgi:hypothetical protein